MCIRAGEIPSQADLYLAAQLSPAAHRNHVAEKAAIERAREEQADMVDDLYGDNTENTLTHDQVRSTLTACAYKNFDLTANNQLLFKGSGL